MKGSLVLIQTEITFKTVFKYWINHDKPNNQLLSLDQTCLTSVSNLVQHGFDLI